MQVEMSEDTSEIIVCMTSRLEMCGFLDILKIPINTLADVSENGLLSIASSLASLHSCK